MKKIKIAAVAALFAVAPVSALAHGDTIHLYHVNNQPVVGMEHEDGTIDPGIRAFGATLNWNATQAAYSTSSPGWTWDESFLSTDSLQIDSLLPLQVWNGATFVNSGLTAKILLGVDSYNTGNGFVAGFPSIIGADDHKHFRYNINGLAQGDPNVAVYRLAFQGKRTGLGTERFPGISIVLNRGASTADADAALAYAQANPVPEPATGFTLAAGWLFLRRLIGGSKD